MRTAAYATATSATCAADCRRERNENAYAGTQTYQMT
jgi:hypothetical protein